MNSILFNIAILSVWSYMINKDNIVKMLSQFNCNFNFLLELSLAITDIIRQYLTILDYICMFFTHHNSDKSLNSHLNNIEQYMTIFDNIG